VRDGGEIRVRGRSSPAVASCPPSPAGAASGSGYDSRRTRGPRRTRAGRSGLAPQRRVVAGRPSVDVGLPRIARVTPVRLTVSPRRKPANVSSFPAGHSSTRQIPSRVRRRDERPSYLLIADVGRVRTLRPRPQPISVDNPSSMNGFPRGSPRCSTAMAGLSLSKCREYAVGRRAVHIVSRWYWRLGLPTMPGPVARTRTSGRSDASPLFGRMTADGLTAVDIGAGPTAPRPFLHTTTPTPPRRTVRGARPHGVHRRYPGISLTYSGRDLKLGRKLPVAGLYGPV
jgi:hypothetical protein